MGKFAIGSNVYLYPMPVTLVGAMVEGRANFMAVGWVTRANARPPMLVVGLNKRHHTPAGIREIGTFSVNIPSADRVVETDYCGIVSGRKVDKSRLFEVFYGELGTAPMIAECPLCLECKLVDIHELPTNDLFIGEIVGAYTEDRYITEGRPDVRKMNPMVLTMPDNNYWAIGEHVAKAYSVGKKLEGTP